MPRINLVGYLSVDLSVTEYISLETRLMPLSVIFTIVNELKNEMSET